MTSVRYNIPLDLTIEILLRLPAKSVFRFRCVSKKWRSILRGRQFAEAFMSLSKPRLLLGFNHSDDNRLMFFSSPPTQSCSFSPSSSIAAAKNNTLTMPKFRSDDFIIPTNSVRGFVCCSLKRRFVVCNPNTSQVIVLPEDYNPLCTEELYLYLGYDPINDQYKVLRLEMQECSDLVIQHSVCTLGGEESSYSWRRIESSILYYYSCYNGVCIDGVVYYEANLDPSSSNFMVVSSFDVATEEIRLVKMPENVVVAHLTNYLGKLAAYDTSNNDRLVLWVLDDVRNQVWSKKTCVFSSFTHSLFWNLGLKFAGVTAAGEIVYFPLSYSDPFELLCYHVEKKVERRVRVEGLLGDVCDGLRSCTSTSQSLCFASVSCCYVDNIMYL